jgi:hypothetical protein
MQRLQEHIGELQGLIEKQSQQKETPASGP